MLSEELDSELTNHMIPFWQGLKDEENGGYYGWLDINLHLDKEAEKGCILNSRILWFFSRAAGRFDTVDSKELHQYAEHAYRFLKEHCLDEEFGGVYWAADYKGNPTDTTKHTYNQAFAIYALTSYYEESENKEALRLALDIYSLIEEHCRDEYGYMEAFTREFTPLSNEKLSENGVIAEKTMNTLLHLLEAYTELYNATGDFRIRDSIKYILDIFADKVYNSERGRLEVFFDKEWNPLLDLYSYGHDIEAAWLITRAIIYLGIGEYREKMMPIIKALTVNIYERAYTGHSVVLEAENGVVDTTRVWWVQCEAIVGFLYMYDYLKNEALACIFQREEVPEELVKERDKYLEAATDIWNYTKEYLIDKRPGSEWFWQVDEKGVPSERPIVEPWKCPYHAGRMCFEATYILKRYDPGLEKLLEEGLPWDDDDFPDDSSLSADDYEEDF